MVDARLGRLTHVPRVRSAPRMEGYGAPTFGDRSADVYDELLAARGSDPDAAADLLAELAGTGPALELAIGTGRIALPLFERGVEVHGIDAS